VWILKSLAYDSVHRADLFKLPCPPAELEAYLAQPDITITEQQPWLLQEFIKVSAGGASVGAPGPDRLSYWPET
jgi:hypothetical protein